MPFLAITNVPTNRNQSSSSECVPHAISLPLPPIFGGDYLDPTVYSVSNACWCHLPITAWLNSIAEKQHDLGEKD